MRFLLTYLLFYTTTLATLAQDAESPMVPGFGGVYSISDADKLPDPSLEYKMVIDATMGGDQKDQNPALYRIARTLNLHALGGVPQPQILTVAVIHSQATPTVLSNASYRKHFGVDNPNDQLIKALTKAGVQIFICGQSLLARGFAEDSLHPEVKKSISAMTILTEYQMKGYALMSF